MQYSLLRSSSAALRLRIKTIISEDRPRTAELIAHLAEYDARKLYAEDGHASMFAYCVDELGLSEDSASKRIQAARTARMFPAIFPAIADGRLHLSAVCMLATHLTTENADSLIATAAHQSKRQIEQLLAERFPKSEMLPLVEKLPALGAVEHAPGHVQEASLQHAPGHVDGAPMRSQVTAHAPGRYAFQVTMSAATHDKLCHAQALLSHRIPSGDVGEVFDRALDALIAQLEKRKLAATTRPQEKKRTSLSARHIPADVLRAVLKRDGYRCTYVSPDGKRCGSTHRLEVDHIVEVARGGTATVDNLRMRCRTHNTYAAESSFGAAFMKQKIEEAQRGAEARRAQEEERRLATLPHVREVVPYLEELGFRKTEAQRAAAACADMADASLEARVKRALAHTRRCGRTMRVGEVLRSIEALQPTR